MNSNTLNKIGRLLVDLSMVIEACCKPEGRVRDGGELVLESNPAAKFRADIERGRKLIRRQEADHKRPSYRVRTLSSSRYHVVVSAVDEMLSCWKRSIVRCSKG
jgi:hypothetical protein